MTRSAALIAAATFAAPIAFGDISTTPTVDPAALSAALLPFGAAEAGGSAGGLTITQVIIRRGAPGQIGTYRDFIAGPVTISSGVVLSSGSVASIGPTPEASLPGYEPSSPPAAVNSGMDPNGSGGTIEFDEFGRRGGNIENFDASFDVAALEVRFTLAAPSQVKFDFVFGSVEFPAWTSQFTDAFLVFLDGTDRNDQVTFDAAGAAVQVGSSFEGLETTADVNTAFAAPHALIHHLTTTTEELSAGPHTLIFEVGDVNDQILDSAAFIANLRAEAGTVGTQPSDDCVADLGVQGGTRGRDGVLDNNDFVVFISLFFDIENNADLGRQGGLPGHDGLWDNNDFVVFIDFYFAGCPGN
jgi:hypothetical protein